MKLYYHKTDGGAEYLTDKYITCQDGRREGVFEGAKFIVRIDGDITKDVELDLKDYLCPNCHYNLCGLTNKELKELGLIN